MFDVAIIGGGPAGASGAAFCARAGLRTLLLERERFPREKVCGDCLNPSCWPVLERLQIAARVRALPHGNLSQVDFISLSGRIVSIALPPDAEIAVKRSLFDELLLARANSLGTEVREATTVSALAPPDSASPNWRITAGATALEARVVVAADGRNSTVARLMGMLPRPEKERVGLQTHCSIPAEFGERIVLQFLPAGYSGQAPVGNGELNLCLVAKPAGIANLKSWAEERFGIPPAHAWRTITPLRRAALPAARTGLFLVGDAARVVEPFTGEGIYYALRSGELAAQAIIASHQNGGDLATAARSYTAAHEQLYRGRLWLNRLARAAVLHPHLTSAGLALARFRPSLLNYLTGKVVASAGESTGSTL